MPKYVIERQYLVPMYQHIVVEAENLEEACKKGISDDIDWDTQEMDSDAAQATTLANAKVIPEGYDADHFQRILIANQGGALASMRRLSIPAGSAPADRAPGRRGSHVTPRWREMDSNFLSLLYVASM